MNKPVGTIIQAVRGMNDILPDETKYWQFVEAKIQTTLQQYGYDEIRFPIVEKTDLFKRSIGEATDIVEKEMYTFADRNEDSLTLRPEGTAGCVRAGVEHGLLYNQIQRLWYKGPFFRHERPQKGRYRQFHQCGVEVFGLQGPDIDAELILLSANILAACGLKSYVTLQLNSIGSVESRTHYRKVLVDYLSNNIEQLDEDSKRRLSTNPLRILDSKNPDLQSLIQHAPKLTDYLDEESKIHFEKLCSYLDTAGIAYEINPCLVRGLDYYTKTVFEWVTQSLGAQGTVCAGGRYDGLVEQLGGKSTPGLGFAIGMERMVLLAQQLNPSLNTTPLHFYFITDSEETFKHALKISDQLRAALPGLNLLLHCGGGSIKNQLKKADKSGARYALILGEQEQLENSIVIKSLRNDAGQESVSQSGLIDRLNKI